MLWEFQKPLRGSGDDRESPHHPPNLQLQQDSQTTGNVAGKRQIAPNIHRPVQSRPTPMHKKHKHERSVRAQKLMHHEIDTHAHDDESDAAEYGHSMNMYLLILSRKAHVPTSPRQTWETIFTVPSFVHLRVLHSAVMIGSRLANYSTHHHHPIHPRDNFTSAFSSRE